MTAATAPTLDEATPTARTSSLQEILNRLTTTGLTIAGRTFRPAMDMTFEHDLWTLKQLRASGIDKAIRTWDPMQEEMPEFISELLVAGYETGTLWRIFAAILQEDGVPWTPTSAEQTADFFRTLTDPAGKKALQGSLIGVLFAFFLSSSAGMETLRSSIESLQKIAQRAAPASPNFSPSVPSRSPSDDDSVSDLSGLSSAPPPSTSEIGTPSSVSSLSSTLYGRG